MDQIAQLDGFLQGPRSMLALAPMQDVTDLPFWRLMRQYGGPDVYYTEYFRVHATSHLEKYILLSITENPTGRPVIAQMIGNDVPALVRTARELQKYPIAGVDLNLGCPAPVVYRKCAGGGLLRELDRVDAILGALRDAVQIKFTVKTRIGFSDTENYDKLLGLLVKHRPDLVTVHARTVQEMYRPQVHYQFITQAVQALPCPVVANGNVDCVQTAQEVVRMTGARGLMVGRGAIRNPWIFQQIRDSVDEGRWFVPTGRDVLAYVRALWEAVKPAEVREKAMVQKMKKYMNYLGVGLPEKFLHDIRRAEAETEFFAICERFLDHPQAMFEQPAFNPASPASLAA